MNSARLSKMALRAELSGARAALTPVQRAAASTRICAALAADLRVTQAEVLMVYLAMGDEVDLRELIDARLAAGQVLAAPVTQWAERALRPVRLRSRQQAVPARFGVPEVPPEQQEPLPLQSIGAVLVPGLGFDRRGQRLGHGAGLYDRFLASLPAACPRLGVSFAAQIVDCLPVEPHDQALNAVFTESGPLASPLSE